MYSSDTAGRTVKPEQTAAAVKYAADFAQYVGDYSQCGVRAQVDVVEDAGVWAGDRQTPPGYDMLLIRHPAVGDEGYSGETEYRSRSAVFPVSDERPDEPNSWLIMHEWLHQVVFFYRTPLGWPVNDVHGGCDRPDYKALDPGYGCMILPHYFADLMTGRVIENGQPKGLPIDQWAYQGTPLNPRRQPNTARVEVTAFAKEAVVSGAKGPAQLSIVNASNGVLMSRQPLDLGDGSPKTFALPAIPTGTWNICVETPDNVTYIGGAGCTRYVNLVDPSTSESESDTTKPVARSARSLLRVKRRGNTRLELKAAGALRGRSARITFTVGGCVPRCIRNRRVVRTVKLGATTTVRVPRSRYSYRRGGRVTARITVRAFTAGPVRYMALSRRVSVLR